MQSTESTEVKSTKRAPAWLRWFAVVAWMAIIFYFSNQPNSNEVTKQYFGGFNFEVRKLAHVTEYAILFFLCRYALPERAPSVVAFLITLLYACSDEWHQSFVPGRSAQFSDVGIDSIIPSFVTILAIFKREVSIFGRRFSL